MGTCMYMPLWLPAMGTADQCPVYNESSHTGGIISIITKTPAQKGPLLLPRQPQG